VWPFVVATTVLAVGGAIGFWRQPRLFFPFVAAAILLGPTTSIVPVKTQTIAEHRMYLPAAFLIGGLVMAVAMLVRKLAGERLGPSWRVASIALGSLIAVAFVGRTIVRNQDFTTAVTLWEQNARDCPGNDRARTNLVAALIRERRFGEATPLARQAVASHPERDRNWLNLGRILAEEHRDAEAAEAFSEAIRRAPGEADARINLGIVLSRGDAESIDAAITVLDEAIRLRPDLAKGWLARGMVRLRQERPDLAIGDLEMAVRLDPENPAAQANRKLAVKGLRGE
jgi:cytochrome c-type biogenesis protein CcmH/NrfG